MKTDENKKYENVTQSLLNIATSGYSKNTLL